MLLQMLRRRWENAMEGEVNKKQQRQRKTRWKAKLIKSSKGKRKKLRKLPCQCAARWDESLAAVHDGQVIDEDDVAL
jgi:hypothetical protein